MTVAELIEELTKLPQDAKVLTSYSDVGYSTVDPPLEVSYARQESTVWWQVYWSQGVPTVDGVEPVIIL